MEQTKQNLKATSNGLNKYVILLLHRVNHYIRNCYILHKLKINAVASLTCKKMEMPIRKHESNAKLHSTFYHNQPK